MPDKFCPAAAALLFLFLAAYPFQSDAETLGMTSLPSASLITRHFHLIELVLICRYLWTRQRFLSTYLFGWLLCISRWQACFYAISSWTNVYFIFATQNKETLMLTTVSSVLNTVCTQVRGHCLAEKRCQSWRTDSRNRAHPPCCHKSGSATGLWKRLTALCAKYVLMHCFSNIL